MNPELWALFCEANNLNDAALKVLKEYSFRHGKTNNFFDARRLSFSDLAAMPYEVRYALTWNYACEARMEEIVAEHYKPNSTPEAIAYNQRWIEDRRRHFDLAMRLLNS